MRTVLGIDPGSRCAGYALATFSGIVVVSVELGVWRVNSGLGEAAGLAQLADLASTWLDERDPSAAAIEGLFHHRNSRSALVLAQARGVLLSVPGARGVEVTEYAPALVKKTVCGSGRADKEQVRRAMLRTIGGLDRLQIERAPVDASDALAIAFCHHCHSRIAIPTGPASGGRRG